MKTIKLYRYPRAEGKFTVSPVMPPEGTNYELRYRLVADENKAVTDGTTVATCVDVESTEGWTEIDAPEEDREA